MTDTIQAFSTWIQLLEKINDLKMQRKELGELSERLASTKEDWDRQCGFQQRQVLFRQRVVNPSDVPDRFKGLTLAQLDERVRNEIDEIGRDLAGFSEQLKLRESELHEHLPALHDRLGWRPPVPRIGCGQLLQLASTVLAFILLGCVGLYKEGPEWVLFFSAGGALGFGGWFAFVATAAWNEDTVEEPKGSFSAPFAMMTGGMAAAVWLYSLVVGLENAPIAVGWAKMFTVVAAVSGLHAVGVFGWVMKTFTSLMGKPLALLLAIALSFQTVVLAVGRLWYGSGILGYLLAASIVGMSISVANAFGLLGRARDFFTGLMGDSQPAGDANDTDTGNGRWRAGTIFVILLAAGGMWVVFPHLPDLMPQPVQVTGDVSTVGKGSDAITADTVAIEEEPTPTRHIVEVPFPAAPEPTVVTVPPSEEEAGEVELSAPVVEPEPTPEPKVKKTAPAPAPVKKSAPKKTTPPKNAEASKGKKECTPAQVINGNCG